MTYEELMEGLEEVLFGLWHDGRENQPQIEWALGYIAANEDEVREALEEND